MIRYAAAVFCLSLVFGQVDASRLARLVGRIVNLTLRLFRAITSWCFVCPTGFEKYK